ncbi:MAG: ABC transporter substrate-binding protein [Planctomycetia bacterium]|nr:ABC transporter substrate-binding protein [Planctomycetia bacterium]
MNETCIPIRVGHSPDADDAFMFYALAGNRIDTGRYRFSHELVDIETLNRRAFDADLELTAVSVHSYAYLNDRWLLCESGASMGDSYGPRVFARSPISVDDLKRCRIAIPGTGTSAYLALRLCLEYDFAYTIVPFDEIPAAVLAGNYRGEPVDAGLVIHEGQLTCGDMGLTLVLETGEWWTRETGLPLPLGANVVRRDLGKEICTDIQRYLLESICYALDHREEALDYALSFGRGLERNRADEFVGMYVNHRTIGFGPEGREAVRLFLKRGFEAGILPDLVEPEFVD